MAAEGDCAEGGKVARPFFPQRCDRVHWPDWSLPENLLAGITVPHQGSGRGVVRDRERRNHASGHSPKPECHRKEKTGGKPERRRDDGDGAQQRDAKRDCGTSEIEFRSRRSVAAHVPSRGDSPILIGSKCPRKPVFFQDRYYIDVRSTNVGLSLQEIWRPSIEKQLFQLPTRAAPHAPAWSPVEWVIAKFIQNNALRISSERQCARRRQDPVFAYGRQDWENDLVYDGRPYPPIHEGAEGSTSTIPTGGSFLSSGNPHKEADTGLST
ncbi:hypothetical protein B0H16DRAFT_1448274 [Mycena metata]|uniref:Uncharacterized protein n=1 Tax=Mycena metata TaxID=1033252 RepID=A0AAD7K7A2_9AGAR|nr:hypothetical protein B0H16DRAFT_1448274 [Mycena metata]